MSIPNIKVVMLGYKGAGKTVLLASMWRRLFTTDPKLGFFIEVPNDQAATLRRVYNIITGMDEDANEAGQEWPTGTANISEWNFTFCVRHQGQIFKLYRFDYLDYAGGNLDGAEQQNDILEDEIESADIMLGLLDGVKIFKAISSNNDMYLSDIDHLIYRMQSENKPVHFVISKWDVLSNAGYSLKFVQERLLAYEPFRNLILERIKEGVPVRLIPVSSVGADYAVLDGSIMRKVGVKPSPFQIEAPLACILQDILRHSISKKQSEQSSVHVPVQHSDTSAGRVLGTVSRIPLFGGIFNRLNKVMEDNRNREIASANQRLQLIRNDIDANDYLLTTFMNIERDLVARFPESDLNRLSMESLI